MKKLTFLCLILLSAVMGQAATYYGFQLGGVKITSDNYGNIPGALGDKFTANDDGETSAAVYDPTSKVLTLTNATISCDGKNNHTFINESCTDMKVVFVGNNLLWCDDASAFRINVNTTVSSPNGYFSIYGHHEGSIYIANGSTLTMDDCNCAVRLMDQYSDLDCNTIEGQKGTEKIVIKKSEVHVYNDVRKYYCIKDIGSIDLTSSYFQAWDQSNTPNVFNNVKGFNISSDMRIYKNVGYDATNYKMTYNSGADVLSVEAGLGVPISATYFPDSALRNYVAENEDDNGYWGKDGILALPFKGYEGEIGRDAFKEINLSGKNISTLKGIEYFTELTSLDCSNNSLTSLDLSKNTKLTYLNVSINGLTTLSLSKNLSLTKLLCGTNKLTRLELYDNKSLSYLDCNNNYLKNLALPLSAELTEVYCQNNALTTLSLNDRTGVKVLNANYNSLTSLYDIPSTIQELNVGRNKFTSFSVTGKKSLTTLDVSNNTSLKSLNCPDNALTSLNAENCTSLSILNCSGNSLTELPFLPNALTVINASSNKLTKLSITGMSNLTTLDVSKNTSLTYLQCSSCALTDLNFTGAPLRELYCSYNKLTSLPALPSSLAILYCGNNQLKALPTLPAALTRLSCNYNSLTFLPTLPSSIQMVDASYNSLRTVSASGLKSLTSLNVSWNPSLTKLNCYSNALTYLFAGFCESLTSIRCDGNQLTNLSLKGLSKLETLICDNNRLTSLLPEECTSLNYLSCNLNQIKDDEMTTLVDQLRTIPAGSTGTLRVIAADYSTEGNEFTDEHLDVARGKNWVPYKYINGEWVEIERAGKIGDVNSDGIVDVADVVALANYVMGETPEGFNVDVANINGDEIVDVSDVVALANIVMGAGE